MKEDNKVVIVSKELIERGIKKYKGIIDIELQAIIKNSNYQYTPYVFSDGRILLVVSNTPFALLYPSKDLLFEKLNLNS